MPGEDVAPGEIEHVARDLVEIEQLPVRFSALEHRAQAPDDLAGAPVRARDVFEDLVDLMQVDGLPSEHAAGGLGVAQNRGQRLAQLVGQRTGELAEDRDAAQMRQELALLLRLTLGALALGDVPDRRDEARVTAHLDGLGRDDRLAQLPVRVRN